MALTTFNVLKSKALEFGGLVPVWKRVGNKIMSGGSLPTDIEKGLYPAGTPVQINTADHTAKILRFFEVAADVSALDTTVSIKYGDGYPTLLSTDVVMVAPATYATTGDAVAVGTVTVDTEAGTASFEIEADAFGVLTAGDILVEAASAGSGKLMLVKPNALLEDDVYVDADTFAATATGVYSGDIYAERINWAVPACVKAALPQIFFDYSL